VCFTVGSKRPIPCLGAATVYFTAKMTEKPKFTANAETQG